MLRLFDFIATAGISKDQYALIQDSMTQKNYRTLHAFSLMGTFFFAVVFFVTFFGSIEALKPKILAYALNTVLCGIIFGIVHFVSPKNQKVINWLQSAFLFTILQFGLYITLVTSPEQLTIAFLPMLMITPHIFTNKPIYAQIPVALLAIIFLIFAPIVKPYEILPLEIVDCVAFSSISLVTGFYSTRSKLRGLIFEKQVTELNNNERLVSYLRSISNIYVSMTYVNLESRAFIQLKAHKYVDEDLKKTNVEFDKQIVRAITETTEPEYLESVLKFVDLNTLPERIRGKSTITHEFVGKNYGWCRARFIAVGEITENYQPSYVIFAVENINEQKNRETHLKIKAETDAMTGLLNRQAGLDKINSFLNDKKVGMLCLFDVDKFKSINDTYGHQTGDEVILAVKEAMKKTFRDNDVLLRLGGDEFIVYIPSVTTEEIGIHVISRFFETLAKTKIESIPDYSISISLGAAFFKGEDNINIDELYHRADTQAYQSKKIEGKSFTFWR